MSTKNPVFSAISCFVLIIVITTVAGVFGPPLVQEETTRLSLTTDTKQNVISVRIPAVTPQNEFLSVFLTFERPNPLLTAIEEHVKIREQGTFSKIVSFLPRADSSPPFQVFYDRFLSYDLVDVRLQVLKYKLITDVFYSIKPTSLQDILDAFLYRMFTVIAFLFILIVLGQVTGNHANDTPIVLKVLFFLALLIIEMAYPVVCNGSEVLRAPGSGDVVGFVGMLRNGLYMIFLMWFDWLSVIQKKYVDDTEKFRFAVYVFVFPIVVLCNVSDQSLTQLNIFRTTSGLFTLHISSLHTFVLLMMFCHWPYDARIDKLYNALVDEKDQTVHDLLDMNDQNP